MSSLYELNNSFMQVQELIHEGSEGLEDTLEMIDSAIEDKLENIGKVIRNLDGEINSYKSEEKRLADKRKTLENSVKRLKTYAEGSLKVVDKRKIKAGTFTFSIQNNPPSLNVVDGELIPKKYYVPVDPKLDNSAIKELLKSGEPVPGVELVQGESLRIR